MHLKAAGNSTGINKDLNLSLAGIDATAAGNKGQAQQIKQVQAQRMQETQQQLVLSTAAFASSVGGLIAGNAARKAEAASRLDAYREKGTRLLEFKLNQLRILQIRELYGNAPYASENMAYESLSESILTEYFKEYGGPMNHLDSINGWAKQQNFKPILRLVGNITPVYIGADYAKHMNAAGYTNCSLLPTNPSAHWMHVCNRFIFKLKQLESCDKDNVKKMGKAFAKNKAIPQMRFDYAD